MALESKSKREEVDARKDELGEIKRAATTSPEEKAAAQREIDELEREALEAEFEAGEETVIEVPGQPELDHPVADVTPTAEEAEENRERIAEVQEGGKDEDEVVEDAEAAVEEQSKDPEEVKEVEAEKAETIEKAASKSRSSKSKSK
jgi:hypothetical protein